jgi:hypothetical protein
MSDWRKDVSRGVGALREPDCQTPFLPGILAEMPAGRKVK